MLPGGGAARPIALPGGKEGSYMTPGFLPGGDDVLIGFQSAGANENEIYMARLRDGALTDPVMLMKNATGIRYTPAGGGRLLFVRNFNLYAHNLNATARRLEGDQELLQEGVARQFGADGVFLGVPDRHLVAWCPGRPAPSQVTIFDRQGRRIGTAGPEAGGFLSLKLSPDERRVLDPLCSGSVVATRAQPARKVCAPRVTSQRSGLQIRPGS